MKWRNKTLNLSWKSGYGMAELLLDSATDFLIVELLVLILLHKLKNGILIGEQFTLFMDNPKMNPLEARLLLAMSTENLMLFILMGTMNMMQSAKIGLGPRVMQIRL